MATFQLSLPKQWEDWCNWLLGIWLCISPWTLQFEADASATHVAVVTGTLIILAELVTLSVYRAWEEWLNIVLGAWLVISSFILDFTLPSATVNFVIVGLLVCGLASYEIWNETEQSLSR